MPGRYLIEDGEKAFEAVGVSQKSAQEFSSSNISDFNRVAEDVRGVDYFSVGAHKQRLQCSDLLRMSHEAIAGGSKQNTKSITGPNNDGLVRPEESEWGRYLMTFPEHDHFDMIGFNHTYSP